MSASSRPARLPSRASATARLAASVDLPTPPLPLPTAMIRFTPGTIAGPACGVGWRPIFRSGGGAGFGAGPCAVRSTETAATPGSAATAASAAARVGSSAGAWPGSTSSRKRTRPPSTVSARTVSASTRLPPVPGIGTAARAARTSSRDTVMRVPFRSLLEP